MITLTTYDAGIALEKSLFSCIEEEYTRGGMIIKQHGQDIALQNQSDIIVIHNVEQGKSFEEELAGRNGLCRTVGVYIVTLSCLNKTEIIKRGIKIADKINSFFYRKNIEVPIEVVDDEGDLEEYSCCVFCDNPYITNVGATSKNRLSFTVTVPWWIWQGGYDE